MHQDGTWIESESITYPSGGFHRNARVFLSLNEHAPIELPYGELAVVRCSIPDTAFTIPARLKHKDELILGYVSTINERLSFTPSAIPERCQHCANGTGCHI